MLIQIDKLKRRPRRIDIDSQANDFPVLKELVEQQAVAFNDSIKGVCEAAWTGDVIKVTGRLETTVTTPCSRCLAPVINPLALQIELAYVVDGNEDAATVEDVEVLSEEIGLIPFTGPDIDLRADLEQEVIMALPLRSLCQEQCRGLCPVCGCDLNRSSCDCEPSVFHAGLAALKNFKIE